MIQELGNNLYPNPSATYYAQGSDELLHLRRRELSRRYIGTGDVYQLFIICSIAPSREALLRWGKRVVLFNNSACTRQSCD